MPCICLYYHEKKNYKSGKKDSPLLSLQANHNRVTTLGALQAKEHLASIRYK
jgi:hypothetical protein